MPTPLELRLHDLAAEFARLCEAKLTPVGESSERHGFQGWELG